MPGEQERRGEEVVVTRAGQARCWPATAVLCGVDGWWWLLLPAT